MTRLRLFCRSLFHFPLLPIWLSALSLLAPVYMVGKALFWGTPLLQFGPWWSYAWESLLSGSLPLWNPLVGMGAPLFANYQSGLMYPPYWVYLGLFAVGGTQWMAWGMAIITACHLAWAGLGMALLARRLGLGQLAQAVSGLAFGLSGYLVGRLSFFSINATAAWLPWILLFLTPSESGLPASRRYRFYLALCIAISLLAGHAQTSWYTLLLAGFWAIFWAFNRPTNKKGFKTGLKSAVRGSLSYGLILGLSGCLAAIQLLPTAEYLLQSARSSSVDYDFALNYSFWPWRFLTFIAPGLFGSPVTGDYWGYGNYWEDAGYIGLLPLLLATAELVFRIRQPRADQRRSRLAFFLVSLIVIGIVLALGKNTPIYPWLYRHIPTFDMFQAPTRWMIWAEFALSLLGGMGADRWRRPVGRGLYWTRLGTMGALAVSAGAGLTWLALGTVSPSFIRAAVILGFTGFGAAVLALKAPIDGSFPKSPEQSEAIQTTDKPVGLWKRIFQTDLPMPKNVVLVSPYRMELWQWSVAVFILLDLLAAGWGLNPAGPLELYDRSPTATQIDRSLDGNRLFLAEDQEYWLKYSRFLRFDTFNSGENWLNLRRVLLPNSTMLDGIATTNNYDPLIPERYAEWLKMLGEASPSTQEDMLRLMAVRWIESRHRSAPASVSFREINGKRLRWIRCGVPAETSAQARDWILSSRINFDEQVILEGLDGLPADDCQAPALSGDERRGYLFLKVDLSKANPNRQTIVIGVDSPGWLVVSDVWYPGWRAWVDGSPVTIYRANLLFRAVRLTEGVHEVVFAYRPLSFYLGAALTLIGFIVLVLLWSRALRLPVSI